jgi:putative ABC transport system permease protein
MLCWWLKLRKRWALDREVQKEIAFHREMRARDEGAPPFGNEGLIREEMREMWTFRGLETGWQDVRYALRGLRRNRGFASTAILSLALGIGASVAIFTVADNLLLRPLPYKDPNRLVMVWEVNSRRGAINNVISPANYLDWRKQNHVFSEMAGLGFSYTIAFGEPGGAAEEVGYRSATPEFFPLLGVNAAIGRVFTSEDALPGAKQVALISDRLWRRRFGGDPAVSGKAVHLDGGAATIIGVLPASFYFLDREIDVWMPLSLDPARNYRATSGRYMSCIARLRHGVSMKSAMAEMSAIGRRLEADYPAFNSGWTATAEALRETLVHDVKTSLYVLLGAVGLLLGVACANVTNLLLARFSARQHEFAIRRSIGAGGARITRQVLTECAVLGCAGGLGGIGVAFFAIRGLLRLAPRELKWAGTLALDFRILGFAMALSVITGLLVGLAPAWASSGSRALGWIQKHQRTGGGGQRLRWLLVGVEVALGVLLMTGSVLLFRTLVRLQASPSGFDARNLMTMKISLPGATYRESAARVRFYNDALARVRALPGVRSAAAVSSIPLHGIPAATGVKIEGRKDSGPGNEPVANVRVVTPDYFRTAGIPTLRGREFEAGDNRRETPHRFVVNQAFVDQYMRGEDPLGRRISVEMNDENPFGAIVGVTGDITDGTRGSRSRPTVYYVHAHLAFPSLILLVRMAAAPESVSLPLQRIIRELDPGATVSEAASMEDVLGETIGRERFSTILLAAFSVFALLLTAIGVYGVLGYTVLERTREIGVRVALGAQPSAITRMFAGKALRFTLAGALVGIGAALALSRFLETLLFEISSRDPLSFVIGPSVLVGVALIASWVPALRAARLNPVEALRTD